VRLNEIPNAPPEKIPSAPNVLENGAQGNKFAPCARNRLGGLLVYTPDLIQEAKN